MERAGPRRKTFEGARERRTSPGLARAGIWLALICGTVPLLPDLFAGSRAGPLFAATRGLAVVWLAAAGACLLAAWIARRGIAVPVTVALDSRCLYVATRRLERRIPRARIEEAATRPSDRREAVLLESSGHLRILVFRTPDQARKLVDALRPSVSRLPARGGPT